MSKIHDTIKIRNIDVLIRNLKNKMRTDKQETNNNKKKQSYNDTQSNTFLSEYYKQQIEKKNTGIILSPTKIVIIILLTLGSIGIIITYLLIPGYKYEGYTDNCDYNIIIASLIIVTVFIFYYNYN